MTTDEMRRIGSNMPVYDVARSALIEAANEIDRLTERLEYEEATNPRLVAKIEELTGVIDRIRNKMKELQNG